MNNAYRQADNDRWQKLDFVVGIRVQLSNNHTYRDHKGRLRTLVDICDDLKGDYPKDFQFTSWHPHCRCIATPILKTREEMKRDRQLIREGKAPAPSKNEVKELPQNFKTWQEKNAKRIAKATEQGKLPHWIRDNFNTNKGDGILRENWKHYFDMYKDFRSKGGGTLEISTLFSHNDKKKPDYNKIKTIGEQFARMGKEVKIAPPIHYRDKKYSQVYGTLIGTKYERKCPDLMINGKPYEFEDYHSPWKRKKVGNMLNKGLKQAPNIIINNTNGASDRYIKKLIFNKAKQTSVNEVWVYERGKIRQIK